MTWPLREKELRVDDVSLSHGMKPGFFVNGLMRNARRFYYAGFFEDDLEIDKTSFVDLDLPSGSKLIGVFSSEGIPVVAILSRERNLSYIEIRTLKNNVVQKKFQLKMSGFQEGSLLSSAHGEWVILRDEFDAYRIFYLKHVKGTSLSLQEFDDVFHSPPKISVSAKGAFVMWRDDQGGGLKLKGKWYFDQASGVVSSSQVSEFLLTDVEEIESWQIGMDDGVAYIPVIIGDSLLGEATLKVGSLKFGSDISELSWSDGVTLRDTHVTEPQLIRTARGSEVMFINWVDEESTIARYIITAGNLSKPSFSGIFPRGSRIMGYVKDSDAGRTRILTRYRNEYQWVYQTCVL